MKNSILLLCVFLSTILQLHAQEKWLNYNASNSGLANNLVTAITTDISGNIWVGLWNGGGVSKYNGSTWTTYNTSNSGLASDMSEQLLQMYQGIYGSEQMMEFPNSMAVHGRPSIHQIQI